MSAIYLRVAILAFCAICVYSEQCNNLVEDKVDYFETLNSVIVAQEMQAYPNELRFDLNPQQIAELCEKIIENTKQVMSFFELL